MSSKNASRKRTKKESDDSIAASPARIKLEHETCEALQTPPPAAKVKIEEKAFDDDELAFSSDSDTPLEKGVFCKELAKKNLYSPVKNGVEASTKRLTDIRGDTHEITIEHGAGFQDATSEVENSAAAEIKEADDLIAQIDILLDVDPQNASKVNIIEVTTIVSNACSIVSDIGLLKDYSNAVAKKCWSSARTVFSSLKFSLGVYRRNKKEALESGPIRISEAQINVLERLKYVHEEAYPLAEMSRKTATSLITTMIKSKPKK